MAGIKIEPNVEAFWQPQTARLTVQGESGTCDVKAYAHSGYPDHALVGGMFEGTPESIDALIAFLRDKNANKLKVGYNDKLDTTWAKGKWRCVKAPFKELRRMAVAIYPPTIEDYTPEKYSMCFLMQDGEELTPWFLELFGRRLGSVVNITVQREWYLKLLLAGEQHRLMNGLSSSGCRAWQLIPDVDKWQSLIVSMLQVGDIKMQNHSAEGE